MKVLYVLSAKTQQEQRVEHIPVDMNTRQTRVGPDHFRMRIQGPDGTWSTTTIRADRIHERKEDRYGHPSLAALGRTPTQ